MKLVNLTPHAITVRVIHPSVDFRGFAPEPASHEDVVIPATGKVARLKVVETGNYLLPESIVRCAMQSIGEIENLPVSDSLGHIYLHDSPAMDACCLRCGGREAERSQVTACAETEKIIFIVSMPVAQVCGDREDVIAPDTGNSCIRENGQIVAVTRFTRYASAKGLNTGK